MMNVVRMRRGARLRLTDNEFELLQEAVKRGLETINQTSAQALPYKVRKIFDSARWSLPDGPLSFDEDRRSA
jgi:hypothetical protein